MRRILLLTFFSLLLTATLGAAFYFIFLRDYSSPVTEPQVAAPPAASLEPAPRQVQPGTTAQSRDLPGRPPGKPARAAAGKASSPGSGLPRVAIIIDDMGYEREHGQRLLALDLDLTFSFLPHGPHTEIQARLAQKKGRDILLHQPMEPIDAERWDPGPGALYLSMPGEEIHLELQKNLAAVPMAIGVNNHMGSRFTADARAMAAVMSVLRPRRLFFVDSLTTADSTGFQAARQSGLPAVRRDIFLDNDRTVEAIDRQLGALLQLARQKGSAVAIAHPNAGTVAALTARQDQLRTAVKVVGIKELVY